MTRRKLIVSFITIFISIFLFSFTVYGWFVNYDQVNNLDFKILQIDSQVSLYKALDSNFNGVPDLLSLEHLNKYYNNYIDADGVPSNTYGSYVSYVNSYYDEKYDFFMEDSKYALSTDSQANLFYDIVINDMLPCKVYTYKFELINYSGFVNNLYFGFSNDFNGNVDILKKLNIRICSIISTESNEAIYDFDIFGGWHKFTSNDSYNGLSIIDESDNFVVPAINEKTGGNGRVDLWLQIKIDDEVNELIELNKFMLPYFRITFEIPDNI